ncbi:uncharacterized protein METZ01_LOCUS300888, partial [marine metagenome]
VRIFRPSIDLADGRVKTTPQFGSALFGPVFAGLQYEYRGIVSEKGFLQR